MADAGRRVHRRGGDVQAGPAGQPQIVLSGEHQGGGVLHSATGQARQLRDRRVRSSERSRERGGGRLRDQEGPDTLQHGDQQTGRLLRSRAGREEGIGTRRGGPRAEHKIGNRLRAHEKLDPRGDKGRFAQRHLFSVPSLVTAFILPQNNNCKKKKKIRWMFSLTLGNVTLISEDSSARFSIYQARILKTRILNLFIN